MACFIFHVIQYAVDILCRRIVCCNFFFYRLMREALRLMHEVLSLMHEALRLMHEACVEQRPIHQDTYIHVVVSIVVGRMRDISKYDACHIKALFRLC